MFCRFNLFIILFCVLITNAISVVSSERKILEKSISYPDLCKSIYYNKEWVKYPLYKDRKAWGKIDADLRDRLILAGEKSLKHAWKPDLASDYLAFKRTGDILTGRENHRALQALTMAELVEGKGRFIDSIIDGVWFLCETSWIHSAHLSFQKDRSGLPDRDEPTLELVVADIGAQLAWTYFFFKEEFDNVSPLINKRIIQEVKKRLIEPYFERSDYWWMGFTNEQVNNWNPWINYNVLQALMLIEENPRRVQDGMWKLMRSVDFFFDMYKDDGACDEGPTYWGGACGYLVQFLDLLYNVTGGKVDVFDNQLLKNMARYIYTVHIGGNYFVNFADSSPKVNVSPGIVYKFGKLINDQNMMSFAASQAKGNNSFKNGVNGFFSTALDEVFIYDDIINTKCEEPLVGTHLFPETQICVGRDEDGSIEGFFFAAKGGHNQESHNHNDVGSCILYYNGEPVLIDVGVGRYTRQTFGPERYSIWTMQSGYHNLPTINGFDQNNGRQYIAKNQLYINKKDKVVYQVDISDAYPEESNVDKWERTYILNRGKNFIIKDSWKLSSYIDPSVINFITCCKVQKDSDKMFLVGEDFKLIIDYDSRKVELDIEQIEIKDSTLLRSWKHRDLYRLRFYVKDHSLSGKNIISMRKVK